MNEEDLRLLQAAAAAGFTSTGNNPDASVLDAVPVPVVAVGDGNLEMRVADLSTDEINAALQVLTGAMGQDHQPPPHPEGAISSPSTIANNDLDTPAASLENLKKLLGFGDQDSDVVGEILKQHNVGSAVREMDNQSPEIDYEGQIADLQRSLAELSEPATRANSPPDQGTLTAPKALEDHSPPDLASWISGLLRNEVAGTAPFVAAPPAQPRGRTRQQSVVDPFEDPVKAAERERVRNENRERKKKWRNQNQERNKDNDLRCRVTKRAQTLYGTNNSAEKAHWIEREFNRRRSKRVTRKEQRIIDNPASNNPNAGSSSVFPAFSNSNSSSPPSFSPVNTESGSFVFGECPPAEEMVGVMHLLANLSGEPGMLETLMGVAVASGYNEEMLARYREESTPNGSVGEEDNSHDFAEIVENIGVLADTLKDWTPEASSTPVPADTPQAPQQVPQNHQGPQSLEEIERINRIEAGFEDLVANLERGLREHHDKQNNGNQGVKPEPKSPNLLPTDACEGSHSSNPTPEFEGLELDHLENISDIDDAIAGLLRGKGEGGVTLNEAGEVEFDDEDIQRLIAEGGADVEMLLNSMKADGTAAAATQVQETAGQGPDTDVEDYTAGADDRVELAQQIQQAGYTPDVAPEGQPERSESTSFVMDGDDLPIAEGMSLDEINKLLADLNGSADLEPMQLDTPTEPVIQQTSPQPSLAPAPQVQEPQPLFNPDPDTSALYTKDTIVAIFKAILEMTPVPHPLSRGTKRPSPSSYSSGSPTKRHRGQTPGNMNTATMAALKQLDGLLTSNGFHPHPAAPLANNQAYVASFGTTDGMNKRLMAMKPPPYRAGGGGGSGGGPGAMGTGVQTKKKTGEEEKKVRAMGFPPLMAGIKRKV